MGKKKEKIREIIKKIIKILLKMSTSMPVVTHRMTSVHVSNFRPKLAKLTQLLKRENIQDSIYKIEMVLNQQKCNMFKPFQTISPSVHSRLLSPHVIEFVILVHISCEWIRLNFLISTQLQIQFQFCSCDQKQPLISSKVSI